jgi:hypothetical protein
MTRSALVAVPLLFVLAAVASGAPVPRPPNAIADAVRGIRAADTPRDTSVLVVLVVDDAGDPLDEVAVTVLDRGKEVAAAKSDGRGRAVFRLQLAGPVAVRAVDDGFVPSLARGVVLRRGGLTALALPLEQAEPQP